MNHIEEETYTCQLCKKNFTKEGYKRHMKKHDGKKNFECKICGKEFIKNFNLTQHMRIHTGEKPFSCEFCNKSFNHKSNCELHKKRHKDQRDHHCNICGKKFFKKDDLENHKRIHTGEKPFSCEFCNKSYSQKSTCERHKKTHKEQRDHHCDICGNKFFQKTNLENHKRIHTGEKPFSCEICNKSFIKKSNCERHKKTHIAPQQGSLEDCGDLMISPKTSLYSSDGLKFQTQSNHKASSSHHLPQSFSSLPIKKQVVDCIVLNDSSTNFIPNSINETFNCFQMQQSLTSELDFGNVPSTSVVPYQTSVTTSENLQANSAIPITLSDNFAGSSLSQENSYHEENIQNQLECPSHNDISQLNESFSDMFIWTSDNRDSNLNQQQQPPAGHLLSKETYERNLKSQFLEDGYHFPD